MRNGWQWGARRFPIPVLGASVLVLLLGSATPTLASTRAATPLLTIHVGNGLVGPEADIVGNGADMWVVSADAGTASEFSESTGAPVRTITGLQGASAASLAGGDLWFSGYYVGDVQEASVATGAVGPQIDIGLVPPGCICDMPGPLGSVADDGIDVWAVNSDFNNLAEVDAASSTVVRTISGARDGLQYTGEVAASSGDAWLTDRTGVAELSASSGVVIRQTPIYEPSGVLVANGSVWVTSHAESEGDGVGNKLTQLSESTGQVVREIAMSAPAVGGPAGMAANGSSLFVANASGVEKFSLATGQLLATIGGPRYGITGAVGVVASPARVWVLDGADGFLSELSATTDVPIRPGWVPPLTPVVGLTVVGSHAWTADSGGCFGAPPPAGTTAEFSTTTGSELEFLDSARADEGCPVGIMATGNTVWVLSWGNGGVDALTSFNNVTGSRETSVEVPAENDGVPPQMVASGGNVWVLRSAWGLVEYSGATGRRLHSYGLKPLGANHWFQAIASDGSNVWIASDASLSELSGSTGAIGHVYTGPSHGFDGVGGSVTMVVGDGRVWIDQEGADHNTEWLSEYGAANGARLGTLQPVALGQSELFVNLIAGTHLVVSGQSNATQPGPFSLFVLNAVTGALEQTLQAGRDVGVPLAAHGSGLWTTMPGVLQELPL